MKRYVRFVAALCIGLLGAVGPAAADSDELTDPEDVPGLLDVVSIRQSHGNSDDNLRHRVTMANDFADRVLGRRGRGSVEFLFSTSGDSCAEFRVIVAYVDGKMKAFRADFEPDGCERFAGGSDGTPERMRARVGRPDDRTLVLAFDRARFGGLASGHYSWSVRTTFRTDKCEDTNGKCTDNAPDSGRGRRGVLAHDLD